MSDDAPVFDRSRTARRMWEDEAVGTPDGGSARFMIGSAEFIRKRHAERMARRAEGAKRSEK
jgi:hypothetical protein